ncbi:actin binding protein [Balamuthia mandrillaris]
MYQQQQQQQKRQVRAIYDYTPTHSNELPLRKGEILSDIVEHEDGWWSGMTSEGRLGVFPSSYVQRMYSLNLPVMANWDYEARVPTELSLTKGLCFTVTDKDWENEWWHGVCPDGRRGWFPGSYVQILDLKLPAAPSRPSAPASSSSVSAPIQQQQQQQRQQQLPAMIPVQPQQSFQAIPQQLSQQQLPPPQPEVKENKKERKKKEKEEEKKKKEEEKRKKEEQMRAQVVAKELKKEKPVKGTLGFVEVHVHEAKGIVASKNDKKPNASVEVNLKEGKKTRKVFKTLAMKGTSDPVWKESFKLNVTDPEDTDLVLVVLDGKKTVAELSFPLRSTEREKFQVASGLDKTYTLQDKGANVGELQITIKYEDASQIGRPSEFQKEQSISLKNGVFRLEDASPKWQKVFEGAGILNTPVDESEMQFIGEFIQQHTAANRNAASSSASPAGGPPQRPAVPTAPSRPLVPAYGIQRQHPQQPPLHQQQPQQFRPPLPAGPRPDQQQPVISPRSLQRQQQPAGISPRPQQQQPQQPQQPQPMFKPPLPAGPRPTAQQQQPQPQPQRPQQPPARPTYTPQQPQPQPPLQQQQVDHSNDSWLPQEPPAIQQQQQPAQPPQPPQPPLPEEEQQGYYYHQQQYQEEEEEAVPEFDVPPPIPPRNNAMTEASSSSASSDGDGIGGFNAFQQALMAKRKEMQERPPAPSIPARTTQVVLPDISEGETGDITNALVQALQLRRRQLKESTLHRSDGREDEERDDWEFNPNQSVYFG